MPVISSACRLDSPPREATHSPFAPSVTAPDDVENNPPGGDDDFLGHGTQSYGQFVAYGLKDVLGDERPGIACRGNVVHVE